MRPKPLFVNPPEQPGAIKASEIAGFVLVGLLAAGLLFFLAIATARSFGAPRTTFTCVPNYSCGADSECAVLSLSCEETEAGGYPDSTCSDECANAFACVDQGCELVGPGRGEYADVTCDAACS